MYVQPGLPGVKLDLTSPGADIEFDDAERPVVALDYNGRKSHKVRGLLIGEICGATRVIFIGSVFIYASSETCVCNVSLSC